MSCAIIMSFKTNRKSSLIGRNSNLWKSEAVNIKRSALASDSPTHTRGPIENGMNLYGWYWNLPLASIQRSGLNVSGSEKLAGSRCIPCTYGTTLVPFGISKPPERKHLYACMPPRKFTLSVQLWQDNYLWQCHWGPSVALQLALLKDTSLTRAELRLCKQNCLWV